MQEPNVSFRTHLGCGGRATAIRKVVSSPARGVRGGRKEPHPQGEADHFEEARARVLASRSTASSGSLTRGGRRLSLRLKRGEMPEKLHPGKRGEPGQPRHGADRKDPPPAGRGGEKSRARRHV